MARISHGYLTIRLVGRFIDRYIIEFKSMLSLGYTWNGMNPSQETMLYILLPFWGKGISQLETCWARGKQLDLNIKTKMPKADKIKSLREDIISNRN